MDNVFTSVKDYIEAFNDYRMFIDKVELTIVDLLKKTGPIEIDDDEEYAFTYSIADYINDFVFKKLDVKNGKLKVTAFDEVDGWSYEFTVDDINGDMYILDALLVKCFEVYDKKKNK